MKLTCSVRAALVVLSIVAPAIGGPVTASAAQFTNLIGNQNRNIPTEFHGGVGSSGLASGGRYALLSGPHAARLDLNSGVSDSIGSVPSTLEPIAAEGAISSDGRWVAFATWQNGIDPGDVNDYPDVYLKDFATGTISLVSRSMLGLTGGGTGPSISGDGSVVAFVGIWDGLVPFDQKGAHDTYAYDQATGILEMVNVDVTGLPPSYTGCWPLCALSEDSPFRTAVSFDGRYVAFSSAADNLTLDTGPSFHGNVYVRDRSLRVTELISKSMQGGRANSISGSAAISSDGRYVAFLSYATDLVVAPGFPPAPPSDSQIYIRDRVTGVTSLISATPVG